MSKLALITGATSGIGEAAAIWFAKSGYDLIITGRRADRLAALSASLKAAYPVKIKTLVFDVRERDAVETSLNSLDAGWQKVDVLVNNAGLSQGLEPINEGNTTDWETMIDTNIKGLLYVSRIVSNWMIEHKKGHIVNLGSIAGKQTYANGNVYCATKHAVDSLSQAMRIDLLPHLIRVTAIHPGAVETEFSEVRFKGDKERAKKVYEGFQPLAAADIADVIGYVVSCPPHVNINDLLIMPTAQANAVHTFRQ
ncbi:SDR family NAD(P)-dependent oxidoreductase [Hufsiella ginkgonis]|uniref:SDR family NAD(P)-dependent oxidoreductase n=1 Tax=Hufsiella ginkgonis TaxID=2695274 RepID=A0A7K1Y3H5_9SPHI|nr:SDR family NAD(P)-dependent oxidoreductase [Hufsiella ginkgonis]MXV17792.1 SDR family NAD(P)-dependent oxidoreductase [Hufsiella ginkgonis]